MSNISGKNVIAGLEAKAFNQGSDARIAGQEEYTNPYSSGLLKSAWRSGWRDVHFYFGYAAVRRISRELPLLKKVPL